MSQPESSHATFFKRLTHFMGIEWDSVSTAEKLASTIGGLLGIFFIAAISYKVTGASGAALIVPSMGASAVLLFAVPHGRLSQPWPLIGGNLVSAVIGVTAYRTIGDPFLAAGLAVGLAIGAMHVLNCIHPPGGATALAAVIGGPGITSLGYGYVVAPILLNVSVIFMVALIFNNFFPWRRYPAGMMRFTDAPAAANNATPFVPRASIEAAVRDLDLVVDLTTDDLQRLVTLALEHTERAGLDRLHIKLGHYYTNGKHGADWSVRQIIDEAASNDPQKDMVIYKVVEGKGLRAADSCTREEFAHWAAREVFPENL